MEGHSDINENNEYNTESMKLKAQNLYFQYMKSPNTNYELIEKAISLDPTNSDIVFEYYRKQKSNDSNMIIKFFDVLTKEQLINFNIKKKMNNREIFFYLINYFESITILYKQKKTHQYKKFNFQSIEDLEKEVEEDEVPYEKEDNDEKNTLRNILERSIGEKEIKIKENLDITKIFIKKETIKLEDLKKKLNEFYNDFFLFFTYKRMYPKFKTEYYYYILIKYLLDTFNFLYNFEFLSKIYLIDELKRVSKKIENNLINDEVIEAYYFFVMAEEYYLDLRFLQLFKIIGIEKNKIFNFNEDDYLISTNLEKNKLIIKKENKTIIEIDNYDSYCLVKEDILDIIEKKLFKNSECLYSLKGYLLNHELNKAFGDYCWELFLSSNLVEEIIGKFFSNLDHKIFRNKQVINIFKNNSYYHPIFNSRFTAFTQKELFKFYFSCKVKSPKAWKKTAFDKLAKRAFYMAKIQHEFFHGCQAYLFFAFQDKNIFDSPKSEITVIKAEERAKEALKEEYDKVTNNIVINYIKDTHKEAGETLEKLLYNRILDSINLKESIYILSKENYSKSLEDFRKGFILLKNKTLKELLEKASINNEDIFMMECYEDFLKMKEAEQKEIDTCTWKSKKVVENLDFKDIENITFTSQRNDHSKFRKWKKKFK